MSAPQASVYSEHGIAKQTPNAGRAIVDSLYLPPDPLRMGGRGGGVRIQPSG